MMGPGRGHSMSNMLSDTWWKQSNSQMSHLLDKENEMKRQETSRLAMHRNAAFDWNFWCFRSFKPEYSGW